MTLSKIILSIQEVVDSAQVQFVVLGFLLSWLVIKVYQLVGLFLFVCLVFCFVLFLFYCMNEANKMQWL